MRTAMELFRTRKLNVMKSAMYIVPQTVNYRLVLILGIISSRSSMVIICSCSSVL